MHTFEGSHRSARFLAASVVDELKWWKGELSKPEWYRSLQPLPLDGSFKIYVDASSSWGIGLVFTASDGTVYWDGWRGRAGFVIDFNSLSPTPFPTLLSMFNTTQQLVAAPKGSYQGAVGIHREQGRGLLSGSLCPFCLGTPIASTCPEARRNKLAVSY